MCILIDFISFFLYAVSFHDLKQGYTTFLQLDGQATIESNAAGTSNLEDSKYFNDEVVFLMDVGIDYDGHAEVSFIKLCHMIITSARQYYYYQLLNITSYVLSFFPSPFLITSSS
jgi:hypothetical protein